jgi:hypothetical protein
MNGKPSDGARTVVMWGASQVGKTTALATYVCERTPSWLRLDEEVTLTTVATLADTWNLLRQNRLPPGTGITQKFDFRDSADRLIRFRDMKGGDAMALEKTHREDLASAEALLVFVSWPGERDVDNLIAAENALLLFNTAHKPTALVITKIECFLTPEQVGVITANPLACKDLQSAGRRRLNVPREFVNLINRFPAEAVFPISVYGYGEDHRPAHYPDEFGRLVPWKIRPLNVARPFEHVIARLS